MEGDAGTGQLNPSHANDTSSPEERDIGSAESMDRPDQMNIEATDADTQESAGEPQPAPGPSRFTRGWLLGTAATVFVAAVAVGAGGYLALRSHQASQATARAEIAAVAAAKDCMAALNAPNLAALQASQRKIIDCATGSFEAQAPMLAGLLADAYAQADVQVEVLDLRAAVERVDSNGAIDVLTVLKLFVTSTGKEVGYRLRVTMEPVDGQYKVAKIDQVAK